MVRHEKLNINLCPLSLNEIKRSSRNLLVTNSGFRYDERAFLNWARMNDRDPDTSDPLQEAITRGQGVFVSSRLDIDAKLTRIPLELYLRSLQNQYPDLISNDRVKFWTANSGKRWVIGLGDDD
eukprot:GHVN01007899.1.p2 GENE.GHVN01007899.1~~GHVN01007899.1.p2  ORF type:complete len:124 (+),score=9.28 GHVN01007899.1:604-975(+)